MEKTVGLEKTAKKNLIKGLLSRMKINRFLLLAYIIMPALVVVVGFSAWTISGSSAAGTNGAFVAGDVINSYDYIQLSKAPNSTGAKFNLFETGFYDPETKNFTSRPTIGIDYVIYLRNCFSLLNDVPGTIYGVFTLKFPTNAPQNPPNIFNGMDCTMSDVTQNENYSITLVKPTAVSTEANEYVALLKFQFNNDDQNVYPETINLNMAYTLSPNSIDYRALYNYLSVDTQKKLAVDVKITKTNPLSGN